MKKAMHFAVFAIIVLLLQGHSFPLKTDSHPDTSPGRTSFNQYLLTYTWFYDENYTVPVGTVSDVNTEVNRLRSAYPWYIFSGSPGIGLLQYEYGEHAVLEGAIIYSNRYW